MNITTNYIYGKDLQKDHTYIISKQLNHFGIDAEGFTNKQIEKIKPFVELKYNNKIVEVTRNTKLVYKGKFRDTYNEPGYRSIKLEIKGTGVILELSENDTFEEITIERN